MDIAFPGIFPPQWQDFMNLLLSIYHSPPMVKNTAIVSEIDFTDSVKVFIYLISIKYNPLTKLLFTGMRYYIGLNYKFNASWKFASNCTSYIFNIIQG